MLGEIGVESRTAKRYLDEAQNFASAIIPYAVKQPEGTGFPGEQLWRFSTDFATGSAGIVHFLNGLSQMLMENKAQGIFELDDIFESYLGIKTH